MRHSIHLCCVLLLMSEWEKDKCDHISHINMGFGVPFESAQPNLAAQFNLMNYLFLFFYFQIWMVFFFILLNEVLLLIRIACDYLLFRVYADFSAAHNQRNNEREKKEEEEENK